ncbi:hypothetical protein BDR04DRAFT_145817 [Suillus decipiens]|nr:hypothetical protein BDR04DRAFT_145817 [Suillus decipiens]
MMRSVSHIASESHADTFLSSFITLLPSSIHSQFTAVNYTIRPSLFRQHYSFNLRTLFIFRSYLSKYDATFFYPSSSHNRSAHPSPRTLIVFSISSSCTLSYLKRILQ